jgi:virulence-associated protein VagC
MLRVIFRGLFLGGLTFFGGGGQASDVPQGIPPVMSYVHSQSQTDLDIREHYGWDVLRAALERTRQSYGDYSLTSVVKIPQKRRIYELQSGGNQINVAIFPARASLQGKLVAVKIPVDFGLLGYRVLLIREGEQKTFDSVRSVKDLKAISFGLSEDWSDVQIMRDAGIPVVTGADYQGLFKMLATGRFDAFSRGATEIIEEYDRRRELYPEMAIERHLLLHYPLPDYFWFPNHADGVRHAERVKAGLTAMLADGTLKTMFDKEFGETIKRLDFDHRRIIEIPNSLLGQDEPLDDPRLWYRPRSTLAE